MAASSVAEIEGIIFDMGGTLRTREPDEEVQRAAREALARALGLVQLSEQFYRELEHGHQSYSKWAQKTLIEQAEEEIWTHWVLPDMPCERIQPIAQELTLLWRQTKGRATVRPDAGETISELARRGYRLGLVSNTISAIDVPRTLKDQGWDGYIPVVILSSTSARRKPDPELFWQATRAMNVDPGRCAYVGDRISRDVVGCRNAGFGLAILIESHGYLSEDDRKATERPDAIIRGLGELLDLFPPRKA